MFFYRNRSGICGDMGRERDTKFGVWAGHIVAYVLFYIYYYVLHIYLV